MGMTGSIPRWSASARLYSSFVIRHSNERGFQDTLIDADHLLARRSHADQRDTCPEGFLDPLDVAAGVRGQVGERADLAGIGLPTGQGLVDRGDPRPLALAGGRRADRHAIGEVA